MSHLYSEILEKGGKNVTNGTWLHSVRAVEQGKGVDHRELACYAALLTPYVRDHLARAAQSIEELYTQLPSVVVGEDQQRAHWENGREAYISRLCEVLHHLGAALTAVGCTDDELKGLCGCEESVKEGKGDIPPQISVFAVLDTDEEESVSEGDEEPEVSVDTRTDLQEVSNVPGEQRVGTPVRHPFGV